MTEESLETKFEEMDIKDLWSVSARIQKRLERGEPTPPQSDEEVLKLVEEYVNARCWWCRKKDEQPSVSSDERERIKKQLVFYENVVSQGKTGLVSFCHEEAEEYRKIGNPTGDSIAQKWDKIAERVEGAIEKERTSSQV